MPYSQLSSQGTQGGTGGGGPLDEDELEDDELELLEEEEELDEDELELLDEDELGKSDEEELEDEESMAIRSKEREEIGRTGKSYLDTHHCHTNWSTHFAADAGISRYRHRDRRPRLSGGPRRSHSDSPTPTAGSAPLYPAACPDGRRYKPESVTERENPASCALAFTGKALMLLLSS